MEQSVQEQGGQRTTRVATSLSMVDYSIFYRRPVAVNRIGRELRSFDILISAFNDSDRVRSVFSDVRASRKFWLIQPEYGYTPLEEPTGHTNVRPSKIDEVTQVNELLAQLGNIENRSICIDITGFMRHVLVFLVAKLAHIGVKEFTALYSEPMQYAKQENTAFSTTTSGRPRTVMGMAGSPHSGRDYLIIAVGYDHKLISEVSNHKDSSTVYPVFAFPSLSPDMYQQSAVRASRSGDIARSEDWLSSRRFAPANDPFSTAAVVGDIVREIDRRGEPANIYLAPLSTKVQALGFAVFW